MVWNKGLTKENNESLKHASEKLKGMGHSKKHCKNISIAKKGIKLKADIDKKELYDLYINKRMNTKDIADKYNCTYPTILARLKEYDIPIRKNWETVSETKKRKFASGELVAWNKLPDVFVNCSICGRKKKIKPYKQNNKYFVCSKECFIKLRKTVYLGENNPNWHGGTSFEPYGLEFNKKLKNKIMLRDSCQCQLCTEFIWNGHAIHHIDYDKNNNNESNLILLCIHCHSKTLSNREYWTEYFTTLLAKEK